MRWAFFLALLLSFTGAAYSQVVNCEDFRPITFPPAPPGAVVTEAMIENLLNYRVQANKLYYDCLHDQQGAFNADQMGAILGILKDINTKIATLETEVQKLKTPNQQPLKVIKSHTNP